METYTEAARAWINRELHPSRWNGTQATIHCPLPEHPDRNASASVNAKDCVWKCHGCDEGGTLTDLAKRLDLEPPPWHKGNGLNASTPRRHVYKYRNAAGKVVFEVVRRERSGGGKAFYQYHHGPDGKEIWELPAAGRGLLYRLPDVVAAVTDGRPVCVVEGEKDADRLGELGFAATCNAMGTGKWLATHSARIPSGANVVIFPDHDQSGMNHVEKVISSLLKAGTISSVHVVDLGFETRARHGQDVSDWLNADPSRGAAEIQKLIDGAVSAADWTPRAPEVVETRKEAAVPKKDARPVVEYQAGERLNWTRKVIAKLVEKGRQCDAISLYAAELVVQGSGVSAGYLVTLHRAPAPKKAPTCRRRRER